MTWTQIDTNDLYCVRFRATMSKVSFNSLRIRDSGQLYGVSEARARRHGALHTKVHRPDTGPGTDVQSILGFPQRG